MNTNSNLVTTTIRLRKSLKDRALAVAEKRGDLTDMIEAGLEREIEKREQRKRKSIIQDLEQLEKAS